MTATVTPIKPAPALPDCLILDSDTTLVIEHNTCSWKAGVPITDPAHIAFLERMNVPRRRYELIPEKTA